MQATLAHERIAAPGAEPARWIYFLHGIYGAGRNWATVARRLVRDRRPDWGAVLVDLRAHGGSTGLGPPYTLAAAADDLRRLTAALDLPVRAVLGHSFGGKVALEYTRHYSAGLEQLWLVDSTPEPRAPSGDAWEMLGLLRRLPSSFPSRSAGAQALEAEGVAAPVAQWMATNLEPADAAYRWRIDFDAMEALLRDFFRSDLWHVIERPPAGVRVHVVRAEASSVLSDAVCARIEEAGRRTGRVWLHRVAGGHWVNVENPAALLELLDTFL